MMIMIEWTSDIQSHYKRRLFIDLGGVGVFTTAEVVMTLATISNDLRIYLDDETVQISDSDYTAQTLAEWLTTRMKW